MIDPRIPLALGDEVDQLRAEINEQARLLGISAEKELALRAENERLKAELKSIDGALDDPRANLTLTTAEIIWEIKAKLAEAKKDAELVDACHEFINSPISVESCERFNKTFEAMKGK